MGDGKKYAAEHCMDCHEWNEDCICDETKKQCKAHDHCEYPHCGHGCYGALQTKIKMQLKPCLCTGSCAVHEDGQGLKVPFYCKRDREVPREVTDGTDPKSAHGLLKLQLSRVPPSAAAYIAWGLEEGIVKDYGAYNWRTNQIKVMEYLSAAKRHIDDYIDGDDIDEDSPVRKPHLAGAIATLALLIDALENNTAIDDRPPEAPDGMGFKKVQREYTEAIKGDS